MDKIPILTLEQIKEITKTYPTPFHIYDEKAIKANAKALYDAFSWNKGYREFFAVKANPNPFILQILKECGCGSDCSSMAELVLSKAVGNTGHMIMFSSNDTPLEEFTYCNELGGIINLDDVTQVDKMAKACGGFPETVSCRFNPGGHFTMSNGIMDHPGDAKYGMTKEQLFRAYRLLRDGGVKHFGIHAFLASNALMEEYYPRLSAILFKLVVEIKKELGITLSFVNLSGGIGIPYYPDEEPNNIAAIGAGVHKAYDEILVPEGITDLAIYTELGRFMLGPYGQLVTQAVNEKHIYKEYIGVDACAVDLIRPAMYGAYHHITVAGKEDAACDHVYDITGSLCENNDKFAIDRKMPKIDMGDYLVIHDAGAHGYAMGYNYNGRLKSAELLLKEDGSVQMIRRAETLGDYFATFDCFPIHDELV